MGSEVSLEFSNSFIGAKLVLAFRFCFYFTDAMTFAFAQRIYRHLLLRTWFLSIFLPLEMRLETETQPWNVGNWAWQQKEPFVLDDANNWWNLHKNKLFLCSQHQRVLSDFEDDDLFTKTRSWLNESAPAALEVLNWREYLHIQALLCK